MQKSIMSQNIANPSMFPLPNRVQYLSVFVYSPENFLISNFIKPVEFVSLFFTHALSLLFVHVTIVLLTVPFSRFGYYLNKHLLTYLLSYLSKC